MAAAAFGLVILLSRRGFEADALDDFKGLNQRSPWFAAMMLLIMVSMIGVPPLAGFYAKWWVLSALVDAGHVWLAIVAVVFSVVGAFYYLRVIKLMYFDDEQAYDLQWRQMQESGAWTFTPRGQMDQRGAKTVIHTAKLQSGMAAVAVQTHLRTLHLKGAQKDIREWIAAIDRTNGVPDSELNRLSMLSWIDYCAAKRTASGTLVTPSVSGNQVGDGFTALSKALGTRERSAAQNRSVQN